MPSSDRWFEAASSIHSNEEEEALGFAAGLEEEEEGDREGAIAGGASEVDSRTAAQREEGGRERLSSVISAEQSTALHALLVQVSPDAMEDAMGANPRVDECSQLSRARRSGNGWERGWECLLIRFRRGSKT